MAAVTSIRQMAGSIRSSNFSSMVSIDLHFAPRMIVASGFWPVWQPRSTLHSARGMCAVGFSPGMPLAIALGNGVLGTRAARPQMGRQDRYGPMRAGRPRSQDACIRGTHRSQDLRRSHSTEPGSTARTSSAACKGPDSPASHAAFRPPIRPRSARRSRLPGDLGEGVTSARRSTATQGSRRESAFGWHGVGRPARERSPVGSAALPRRRPPNGLLREHVELVEELPLPDPGVAAALRQLLQLPIAPLHAGSSQNRPVSEGASP